MTKLTAATITDEQIRALLDEPTCTRQIRVLCKSALNDAPVYLRADTVNGARRRLVEILNARNQVKP